MPGQRAGEAETTESVKYMPDQRAVEAETTECVKCQVDNWS